ncbi:hypothetical protein SAMN06265348_110241 [Pedobacter westerhofensis]|uniref:Uncharacterized protein n=1 Tax=Pedobacter westerhofensis TaxID=425512 RepID=A0A521F8T4_9SPHI|nr:hypothetical protein [Pedobacter westerhofensis]SMO91910.1 hypothetical protein SAMN06265348_110241 [Pedobacter westerhofensis]
MIKDIIIEIEGVHISDFNTELPEPPFTEATEGGISIMFTDIDELKSYHSSLVAQDDAEGDAAPKPLQVKIAAAVKKGIRRNEMVLDAIRTYAESLFSFIFNADAHRKDRLMILDTVIADVQESDNSLELQKAVIDATFELGDLSKNDKSKFYDFAHNESDFYFDKIKNELLKELTDLRAGLLS